MSKMGLHDPFGHLQHKFWPKERSRVKLAIWLSTTESQESTRFPCVQVVCNTSLESSWQGLQLWFRPRPDRRSAPKVIVPQSCKTPSLGDFGSPWTKNHLDAIPVEWCRVYHMGEGGGFPWVWVVVNLVSPELPVACLSTKGVPEIELTNLLVGLM
jgi:hypothetical protein